MQREKYTVGTWCVQWFESNRHKWNPRTEGGYRNLIEHHTIPGIGSVQLTALTEQLVTAFYEDLQSRELSNRTIWCIHLLLRRCMDEAGRDGLIHCNPVRSCAVPEYEEHRPNRLRLGQIQRYLNASEQLNVLPMIYIGLTSGLRQCEVLALTWAAFHVPYKYIHRRGRLLTLNTKASALLKTIEADDSPYVFLNPKTSQPYRLHEFYYLHKVLLKRAGLPWISFRDLQYQCMEVGL